MQYSGGWSGRLLTKSTAGLQRAESQPVLEAGAGVAATPERRVRLAADGLRVWIWKQNWVDSMKRDGQTET